MAALTFVFLFQMSLAEREQADLHGQDADLSTATTADNKSVIFINTASFRPYVIFIGLQLISDLNYMQQL